ncbi:MAG: hypothetical protein K8R86_00140, partial [Bacteroidales bacterium]|nr:hypothetical protein [Bacteroidales bacterium]
MKSIRKNSILILGLLLLGSWVIISCDKEEDEPPPPDSSGYSEGVFIVNEGPFQTGTGTVTYLSRDGSGIEDHIFQKANNLIPLGNIVQSMTLIEDKVYIAVNNANKIEIVSLKTFQSVQTLENITSPRYIAFD